MDRMTSFTRVLGLMVSIVIVSVAFIGCVGGPLRVVIERDRGEEVVIIERHRHGPAYYSREHWTLRELVDNYRYEMASRGWTLRKMEIEEKKAEMKFTRGGAKAKIKIKAEKGTFKVKMKSSHDD